MAVVRTDVYTEVIEFLLSRPTLEQVIAFRPSEALDAHLSDLLDKNRHGRLTDLEQAELDQFDQFEHLMRLLKAHAQLKLQRT